jgi:hypothetical protein
LFSEVSLSHQNQRGGEKTAPGPRPLRLKIESKFIA